MARTILKERAKGVTNMHYVFQNDILEGKGEFRLGSAGFLGETDTLKNAKELARSSGYTSLTIIPDETEFVYNTSDACKTWTRE